MPTSDGPSKEGKTLAEMLFYLPDQDLRDELESFRKSYEANNSPTDLTKYYTSMRSLEEQEWLIKNETQRYYDGLPPFVKAYMKAKMRGAARLGNLDDMPATYLALFVAGKMHLDHDGPYEHGR